MNCRLSDDLLNSYQFVLFMTSCDGSMVKLNIVCQTREWI
jgi:hypothetical protein